MPPVVELSDQKKLVPVKSFPSYAHFPFETFNPVQSRIFEIHTHDANAIIAAATSAGKAQPDNSLILTPTGYVRLCDLQVGDEVIGLDGKPTSVTGVFPQGIKPIFKVSFNDDTSTFCSEDHLWAVQSRHIAYHKRPYKVVSTNELLDGFKKDYWRVPQVSPVCFPHRNVEIDPYVLGLLIGDGGIRYGTKISNKDQDVLDLFSARLPEGLFLKPETKCDCYHGVDYAIVSEVEHYNPLARALDRMGLLGCGSTNKFIPYIYKFSSVEQRVELLRGLLDSDGYRMSGGAAEFGTASRVLSEDVAFLVRSLGGKTRVRKSKCKTYSYDGEKHVGLPCYRLTVSLKNIVPFHSNRKKQNWNKDAKRFYRKISSIVPAGEDRCRCISVANDDGLYVTNDFIVTHNTVCAEMMMSHEVRQRGGKAMYLAPLRALAKEKIDDWTDNKHHFGDLSLSICTGDYRLTPARRKELEAANIILMTSEMLNSRCRNFKSENNTWLQDVGTLVVDESHLLTVPGRGDHLEVGLMKFCEIAPKARLNFLSATMPNVKEIAEWVSYDLNGQDTYLLKSDFRPVPLGIHYEYYHDAGTYDDKESEKVRVGLSIVEDYPDDKFLLFVHTKRTGKLMLNVLQAAGIQCEFHNADLEKDHRHALENRFRQGDLRVIVATSTLAWGMNLPARRVIILGVHRGLSEVETYDIWQMAGRAGRVGLDPRGDVYILLPDKKDDYHHKRIMKKQKIRSRLLDFVGDEEKPHYKTLAFHLVSEIHHGGIKTRDDVHHWYKRSLAHWQDHDFGDNVIDSTLSLLFKCGAVYEEDDVLKCTSVGVIASMFYFSPFDVADLRRNFSVIFDNHYEDNDMLVSVALGNIDTLRHGIVSKAEREDMGSFAAKISQMFGSSCPEEPSLKGAFAYFSLLRGLYVESFAALRRNLQMDFPRTATVLKALDKMSGKWDKGEYLRRLQLRINYGVRAELVDLCQIPDVGKVRAEKLWSSGIRTVQDVVSNPEKVAKALGYKQARADKLISTAKAALLVSS